LSFDAGSGITDAHPAHTVGSGQIIKPEDRMGYDQNVTANKKTVFGGINKKKPFQPDRSTALS